MLDWIWCFFCNNYWLLLKAELLTLLTCILLVKWWKLLPMLPNTSIGSVNNYSLGLWIPNCHKWQALNMTFKPRYIVTRARLSSGTIHMTHWFHLVGSFLTVLLTLPMFFILNYNINHVSILPVLSYYTVLLHSTTTRHDEDLYSQLQHVLLRQIVLITDLINFMCSLQTEKKPLSTQPLLADTVCETCMLRQL